MKKDNPDFERKSPTFVGIGNSYKILVIQQKMIGDVLVSSLICENLKLNYPKTEIHYLVNRFTIPVIENNPYIDKIVIFEDEYRSSKFEFYKFLKGIKKAKYDVVIDAYGKLESNLITTFSGAKTKISREKNYTKFIYTDLVTKIKKAKTKAGLAVEDRLNLLSPFGLNSPLQLRPKIYLTENEKEKALSKLKDFNIDASTPLYIISVLGSDPTKSYPIDYMAKVLDHIVKSTDKQIIFNHEPHQKDKALEVYNHCKKITQEHIYLDLTPSSLREFMAITYHCNALIGNEGGAVNMAKAIDIPTFTIFSPWINKKAWSSFENDKKHISVHLEDFKPEYYKNVVYSDLRPLSESLYRELVPEKVISALDLFID